jgi:hypothetical protein
MLVNCLPCGGSLRWFTWRPSQKNSLFKLIGYIFRGGIGQIPPSPLSNRNKTPPGVSPSGLCFYSGCSSGGNRIRERHGRQSREFSPHVRRCACERNGSWDNGSCEAVGEHRSPPQKRPCACKRKAFPILLTTRDCVHASGPAAVKKNHLQRHRPQVQ